MILNQQVFDANPTEPMPIKLIMFFQNKILALIWL